MYTDSDTLATVKALENGYVVVFRALKEVEREVPHAEVSGFAAGIEGIMEAIKEIRGTSQGEEWKRLAEEGDGEGLQKRILKKLNMHSKYTEKIPETRRVYCETLDGVRAVLEIAKEEATRLVKHDRQSPMHGFGTMVAPSPPTLG
jgi:hypothetical protein